jgi:hypothetical protein
MSSPLEEPRALEWLPGGLRTCDIVKAFGLGAISGGRRSHRGPVFEILGIVPPWRLRGFYSPSGEIHLSLSTI